jgi:hypothetical protein
LPGFTTLPEIEKIAVPGAVGAPVFANFAAPISSTIGSVAIVQTLFTCVGAS